MSQLFRSISLIAVLLVALPVHADDTPLEFKDAATQHRYMEMIEEIRCLVCQNQSLADSHADLAQDLRQEIFNMIGAGKSNEQIIEFLVQRYGDFVLYRPPMQGTTLLLWCLPFVFLVAAVISVIYFIRLRSVGEGPELSREERDELDRVLGEKNSGV
jgi:cytochrome c-type biogenesis protein CcmH